MTRRGFLLRAVAAISIAPLSRLLTRTPVLYGDGFHDDTLALRAWGAGLPVNNLDGTPVGRHLAHKKFVLRETLAITRQDGISILACYFDMHGLS